METQVPELGSNGPPPRPPRKWFLGDFAQSVTDGSHGGGRFGDNGFSPSVSEGRWSFFHESLHTFSRVVSEEREHFERERGFKDWLRIPQPLIQ